MNADDLTPAEKDAVQMHYLRRWLADRQPARRRIVRHWIAKKPRWPRLGSWSAQNHLKSVDERFPDDPTYVIQGS